MEKFSYEAKGYNRSEVNQFISEVIKETEGIITRVKKQNIEIENLKKELNHYKELEKTLSSTINKMEETKEKQEKLAHEEGLIIVNEAKHNASRIVNEALLKAQKIENNAEILEKNMRIFKKKLKVIIEQQMAVVDEIEVLELESD